MSELSKEQVDKAAKVACNTYAKSNDGWPHSCSHDDWRDAVTAAAKFLQYPIAPPTEAEIDTLGQFLYLNGSMDSRAMVKALLTSFAKTRNAAINPPVDPRREKVAAAIQNACGHGAGLLPVPAIVLAKAILAALDEK